MNTITVAGHLGRDPETRFTPSGQKVTNFTIAVNQRKGKEEFTVWYRITVWGERFDKMISFLKKGSAVIVVGELGKPEVYTDKEGRPQVSLDITAEIIRFSPFGGGEKRPGQEGNQGTQQGYSNSQNNNSAQQAPQDNFSDFGSNDFGSVQNGSAPRYASTSQDDALPF